MKGKKKLRRKMKSVSKSIVYTQTSSQISTPRSGVSTGKSADDRSGLSNVESICETVVEINSDHISSVTSIQISECDNSASDIMPGGSCSDTKSTKSKKRVSKLPRLTIYFVECQYPVVRNSFLRSGFLRARPASHDAIKVVSSFGTKLDKEPDIIWSDSTKVLSLPFRLNPFQRVNHFPEMANICRKDFLGHHFNALSKLLPYEFDFYPRTWILPNDLSSLEHYAESKPNGAFIVKPKMASQGQGIWLTNAKDIPTLRKRGREPMVVQRYIGKPHLLDGFKYDLRLYVLVSSADPLQVYIYRDGLARLCTQPYQAFTRKNASRLRMHLTNFSINGSSKEFIRKKAEDKGSKRSFASVLNHLQEQGKNVDLLWSQICSVVLKTILAVHPLLREGARSYFGDRSGSSSPCFEILGFDVMLDHKLRPWVIEVNSSPSFQGGTSLDRRVKTEVVTESIQLLGMTREEKRSHQQRLRRAWKKRLWVTHTKRNSKKEKKDAVGPAAIKPSTASSRTKTRLPRDNEQWRQPRSKSRTKVILKASQKDFAGAGTEHRIDREKALTTIRKIKKDASTAARYAEERTSGVELKCNTSMQPVGSVLPQLPQAGGGADDLVTEKVVIEPPHLVKSAAVSITTIDGGRRTNKRTDIPVRPRGPLWSSATDLPTASENFFQLFPLLHDNYRVARILEACGKLSRGIFWGKKRVMSTSKQKDENRRISARELCCR